MKSPVWGVNLGRVTMMSRFNLHGGRLRTARRMKGLDWLGHQSTKGLQIAGINFIMEPAI